jgi:hypothetical protein
MGVGEQKHAVAQMSDPTAAQQKPMLGSLPRELGIRWGLGYISGCSGTGPESLDAIIRWLRVQVAPFWRAFGTTLPFNELRIQNQFSCGRKPRRYSCSQWSREVYSSHGSQRQAASGNQGTGVARHLHGSTTVTVRSHPRLYVGHIRSFSSVVLFLPGVKCNE